MADNTKTESGLQVAELPEEGTIVSLKDLDKNGEPTGKESRWIEGTGASQHLPKAKKYFVNNISADKLISKGSAVETAAPREEKKAKKK
jgi:hypothetical protein